MSNSKPRVVMKFGGTSVGDPQSLRQVAQHIKEAAATQEVVVVVSAMGHTTDRIIKEMIALNPDPPPREMDVAMHIGEIESAAKLANVLCGLGGQAMSLTGNQMRLVAGGQHRQGRILRIDGAEKMEELLSQGMILICAGFQGVDEEQNIITLGRGGSDTTAVALAHALKAECQIYTDVDGVYAVDPRLVANAKRFAFITYSDMLAMSAAGAGVLMDRSVLLARTYNVALRVLISPSKGQTTGGTLVGDRDTGDGRIEADELSQMGLAVRNNVAVITINNVPHQPGMAAAIYKKLEAVVIGDLIQGKSTESTASISLWVDSASLKLVQEQLADQSIQTDTDLACLTLIGSAMKEGKGFLARLSQVLAQAGINIQMQASAGQSILTIIAAADLSKAAAAIAAEFNLCQ